MSDIAQGQVLAHQVYGDASNTMDSLAKASPRLLTTFAHVDGTGTETSSSPYVVASKPLGMSIFSGAIYSDTGEIYNAGARMLDRNSVQVGRTDLGDNIGLATTWTPTGVSTSLFVNTLVSTRPLTFFVTTFEMFDDSGLASVGL